MSNIKENKKFHFTYKTTNLINNRYYLGMHSTNRIDDGYLGSGKRLYYELNKYGRDNFKFEILEHFNSREELVQAEITLITRKDIKDPNCLNCKPGGSGGFDYEIGLKGSFLAKKAIEEKRKDPQYVEKMLHIKRESNKKPERILNIKKALQEHYGNNSGNFKGKKHKPETIEKMEQSHRGAGKGNNNSQYGTCWITDEYISRKIYRGEIIPEGWRLGRKLKKL